ncbi:MAG: hypothetical protein RLY86_989 [Pseudomonadota bacterium]|jgi:type VI secretion system ImpA family protein
MATQASPKAGSKAQKAAPAVPPAPAAPTLLDVEALLRAIPHGDPAGEDIRYGAEHDQIKDARREDADLPQGVWKSDRKRADWVEVVRLGRAVLTDRSKDLQVAAWMCEALLGRHGVAGLSAGLRLLAGLVATFGPAVHPRPDEDGDQSRRTLIFEWLGDRVVVQLLTLPVTTAPADRETGLTFGELLNVRRLAQAGQREAKTPSKAAKAGPATLTLQSFNAAVRATPTAFYHTLFQGLVAAVADLQALKSALDGLLGDQAPSLSDLLQRLEDMGQWTYTTLRERGEDAGMALEEQSLQDAAALAPAAPRGAKAAEAAGGEEVPGVAPDAAASAAAPPATSPAAAVASRRDAYRRLAEVADYLVRTEPHSPVPYLLHRIVQWRDMPLPALLAELSRGRRDVAALFELLGHPEGTDPG